MGIKRRNIIMIASIFHSITTKMSTDNCLNGYDFSKERSPAPNVYYPEKATGLVKPKAPQVSFKGHKHFGHVDNHYPSPNTYTLPAAVTVSKPRKLIASVKS